MIVLIYGTRPEAIKLGPVAEALRAQGVPFRVLCTGQHSDLLSGTPAESDLSGAESLGLPSTGAPLSWLPPATARLCVALERASHVVVQGDTSSALAGANAAAALSLPLAHVEAGVRSHDLNEPWPEEGFRCEITKLASLHLTPTPATWANLRAEGVELASIRLTGNSVVSAIERYVGMTPRPPARDSYLMLTMHRREWLRDHDIVRFCAELAEACADHPALRIFWPVHPAVRARLPSSWDYPDNLVLEPPKDYRSMIWELACATGIVTDSGGLVEEAATLGVPCAIMRRRNDRPEAVEAGVARQFDPTQVWDAVTTLARGALPRRATECYGTARAADEIARQIARWAGRE